VSDKLDVPLGSIVMIIGLAVQLFRERGTFPGPVPRGLELVSSGVKCRHCGTFGNRWLQQCEVCHAVRYPILVLIPLAALLLYKSWHGVTDSPDLVIPAIAVLMALAWLLLRYGARSTRNLPPQ